MEQNMAGRLKIVLITLIAIALFSYAASKLAVTVDFQNKIAVIKIDGPIGTSSRYFDDNSLSPETIVKFIEKANEDKSVKGIILDINSPGGSVVGSEEIKNAVKGISKPKVALIRDVGASGAYWVASAADKIIADPMSITGSIGVLGSYVEF